MKIIAAAIAASFIATALPASAEQVDLSSLPCKEFTAMTAERKSLIVMWLTGYTADPDAPLAIGLAKSATDLASLEKTCSEDPEQELITAAEGVFGQ